MDLGDRTRHGCQGGSGVGSGSPCIKLRAQNVRRHPGYVGGWVMRIHSCADVLDRSGVI